MVCRPLYPIYWLYFDYILPSPQGAQLGRRRLTPQATLPNKPQKHVGPYYYTGLEILGQGQFGVVHKGYRTSDGTPVAIKVIPKKQRLARELDILTRLDHPNVVKMLHYEVHLQIMPKLIQ